MKLDKPSIAWIEKAIDMAPFGQVTLVTQNGRIMKIVTESKLLVSLISPEGVDNFVPIAQVMRKIQS